MDSASFDQYSEDVEVIRMKTKTSKIKRKKGGRRKREKELDRLSIASSNISDLSTPESGYKSSFVENVEVFKVAEQEQSDSGCMTSSGGMENEDGNSKTDGCSVSGMNCKEHAVEPQGQNDCTKIKTCDVGGRFSLAEDAPQEPVLIHKEEIITKRISWNDLRESSNGAQSHEAQAEATGGGLDSEVPNGDFTGHVHMRSSEDKAAQNEMPNHCEESVPDVSIYDDIYKEKKPSRSSCLSSTPIEPSPISEEIEYREKAAASNSKVEVASPTKENTSQLSLDKPLEEDSSFETHVASMGQNQLVYENQDEFSAELADSCASESHPADVK